MIKQLQIQFRQVKAAALLVLLLCLPLLSSAITLQITTNPSNCPSSGRMNFAVSDLMPGSPGPVGIPPSVVFHIWNMNGMKIAGSTSHSSFANAYTTSDISLGGLTAGSYVVRTVESYGSNTASSADVILGTLTEFGLLNTRTNAIVNNWQSGNTLPAFLLDLTSCRAGIIAPVQPFWQKEVIRSSRGPTIASVR